MSDFSSALDIVEVMEKTLWLGQSISTLIRLVRSRLQYLAFVYVVNPKFAKIITS